MKKKTICAIYFKNCLCDDEIEQLSEIKKYNIFNSHNF